MLLIAINQIKIKIKIMETPKEILTLKAVADCLGYKNTRTVIRWCINNGVSVFSYGSKWKFVSVKQFELTFFKRS